MKLNRIVKATVTFLLVSGFVLSSCRTDKHFPLPWDQICSDSLKSDGMHPGQLYFLNRNKDTLTHLDFLSHGWIIVEDNQRVGISFEKVYLPGTSTTDREGMLQLKDLQEMKFFVVQGCDTSLTSLTFEDLQNMTDISD